MIVRVQEKKGSAYHKLHAVAEEIGGVFGILEQHAVCSRVGIPWNGGVSHAVAGTGEAEKQTSVISVSLGRGFRSVHLVSGLCGSSETGGNWRDFKDSGYPKRR